MSLFFPPNTVIEADIEAWGPASGCRVPDATAWSTSSKKGLGSGLHIKCFSVQVGTSLSSAAAVQANPQHLHCFGGCCFLQQNLQSDVENRLKGVIRVIISFPHAVMKRAHYADIYNQLIRQEASFTCGCFLFLSFLGFLPRPASRSLISASRFMQKAVLSCVISQRFLVPLYL